MHRLLVLAGGFGTRLKPAVGDVPKPLAPVSGRPYLAYLMETWLDQGVVDITFLLHYRSSTIETFLEQARRAASFERCSISVVTESKPLGTGGAVANAARRLGLTESFLVANADTWLGGAFAAFDRTVAPCVGVVQVADTGRYGAVEIDGDRIVAFHEKDAARGAGWINAGLYHLRPQDFFCWDGAVFSLERDLFPRLSARRELGALRLESEFIDIGVPDDYRRFCRWIETGKVGAP